MRPLFWFSSFYDTEWLWIKRGKEFCGICINDIGLQNSGYFQIRGTSVLSIPRSFFTAFLTEQKGHDTLSATQRLVVVDNVTYVAIGERVVNGFCTQCDTNVSVARESLSNKKTIYTSN